MTREEFGETVRRWLALLPVRELREPAPVVTVIRLSGVIGRIGPVGTGMTLAGLERAIERGFVPRQLKCVALVINSPGGSPVQAAMIARRIRERAAEKKVPVVAFAEDLAASGGYWLACAGDEIYADENSLIGSIGVITSGFGFPALLDRYGVQRRVYTAGRRKGMLDPFREESPEDIARLHSIQVDIHESFKAMVRDRRGIRLTAPDDELFEGDVWTGRQALALGLVDGIGDLRTVMRARFGDRVRIRSVTRRPGLLQRLFGRTRTRSGPDAQVWAVLAALDEWALWKQYGL